MATREAMNPQRARWRWLAGLPLLAALAASPQALATPDVQVGFSPEGSALALVLSTVDEAQHSLRVMGYSFTSPEVVRALMAAHRRGVDVKVVVDDKHNRSKAGVAALNLLVNAGIEARTLSRYKILHDKVIISDGVTVQTGSFNYSRAADKSNSENVVVLKAMPAVAKPYLAHWQSRWDQGQDWHSTY